MNFIIKYILKFLDSFTEKQITNYLKIIFSSKIPLIIDVGSHKGEYNMLKNVTNIIDITNSLDESKNLSYDDGIHYSLPR